MSLSVFSSTHPDIAMSSPQFLATEHVQVLEWLKQHAETSVVLAPPKVSLWIPAYSAARVVYGHDFETLNSKQKLADVEAWYAGQDCTNILNKYGVRYIVSDYIDAPDQSATRGQGCFAGLGDPVASFQHVLIFEADQ
jgi:hypothetical protein